MGQKRQAIPLPDLKGKRVLDLGCDYGYWCKLASDLGASRVVGVDRGREVRREGFVELAARNRAQDWPRCEFYDVNLGAEWPVFGQFDVIFCFALYHHWYGQCGDHKRIWEWLAQHTAPGGVLLWEGPYDEKDSIVVMKTKHIGGYTRENILNAAHRYFVVEVVGPALYRRHREVWRCVLHGTDPRDRL
jgi:SAM-dependent methyltransferase